MNGRICFLSYFTLLLCVNFILCFIWWMVVMVTLGAIFMLYILLCCVNGSAQPDETAHWLGQRSGIVGGEKPHRFYGKSHFNIILCIIQGPPLCLFICYFYLLQLRKSHAIHFGLVFIAFWLMWCIYIINGQLCNFFCFCCNVVSFCNVIFMLCVCITTCGMRFIQQKISY